MEHNGTPRGDGDRRQGLCLDDTTQLQGRESVSKSSEGQELLGVLQLEDSLISSQQCWVRYIKQEGSQWLKICLLRFFFFFFNIGCVRN